MTKYRIVITDGTEVKRPYTWIIYKKQTGGAPV